MLCMKLYVELHIPVRMQEEACANDPKASCSLVFELLGFSFVQARFLCWKYIFLKANVPPSVTTTHVFLPNFLLQVISRRNHCGGIHCLPTPTNIIGIFCLLHSTRVSQSELTPFGPMVADSWNCWIRWNPIFQRAKLSDNNVVLKQTGKPHNRCC